MAVGTIFNNMFPWGLVRMFWEWVEVAAIQHLSEEGHCTVHLKMTKLLP